MKGKEEVYTGSFNNNTWEGIGTLVWTSMRYEGEFKDGEKHGKVTCYHKENPAES